MSPRFNTVAGMMPENVVRKPKPVKQTSAQEQRQEAREHDELQKRLRAEFLKRDARRAS